jgi:hypothetical protein
MDGWESRPTDPTFRTMHPPLDHRHHPTSEAGEQHHGTPGGRRSAPPSPCRSELAGCASSTPPTRHRRASLRSRPSESWTRAPTSASRGGSRRRSRARSRWTGQVPTATGSSTVVPVGATGVVLNVTAVQPSADGFISVATRRFGRRSDHQQPQLHGWRHRSQLGHRLVVRSRSDRDHVRRLRAGPDPRPTCSSTSPAYYLPSEAGGSPGPAGATGPATIHRISWSVAGPLVGPNRTSVRSQATFRCFEAPVSNEMWQIDSHRPAVIA